MKEKKILKKSGCRSVWLNLLAMAVVLAAVLMGLQWWLLSYTHHGESIEVPDFYGMDYRKAMEQAEEEGLQMMVNDSTYIKEMTAGSVVVQSPAKGQHVKEGRTVYVTINSLTIPRVRIPAGIIDEIGYQLAERRLTNLGFKLQAPKLVDGDKDLVYGIEWEGRDVRAGDMVARGSSLTLRVGKGVPGGYYGEEDFDDEEPAAAASQGDNGWPASNGEDEEDDFVPVIIDD